jgi:hypothetical protein
MPSGEPVGQLKRQYPQPIQACGLITIVPSALSVTAPVGQTSAQATQRLFFTVLRTQARPALIWCGRASGKNTLISEC